MSNRFEEDEDADKKEQLELKKIRQKMPIFARLYIWLKQKCTEQIIFINNERALQEVRQDMYEGKTVILNKIERKILKDMREIRMKKLKNKNKDDSTESEYDLKDMHRTQKFIRFGNMLKHYIGLIFEIIISYSDCLCYFFMFVSMLKNAGLISLVYPFMVFGYALMEETSPKKTFWYVVLLYTEGLIFTKFLIQLEFWDAILSSGSLTKIENILVSTIIISYWYIERLPLWTIEGYIRTLCNNVCLFLT